MINNLNECRVAIDGPIKTQVCILGAGTSGIFLAKLLSADGVHVVLLEAGDKVGKSPGQIGEICEQKGVNYRGANNGRCFGIGGTSALWGGQMIGLMSSDVGYRNNASIEAWPIDYDEIELYYSKVCSTLGINLN